MTHRHIISWLYRRCLKPLLFLCHPEKIHTLFVRWWHILWRWWWTRRITHRLFAYQHPHLEQTIAGLRFANPIGLSAWFDKEIDLVHIASDVWFGFASVWSITAHPYAGNPWTRLVRLPKSRWLLVYYWLKNKGAEYACATLERYQDIQLPIWISIAKTNSPTTTDLAWWVEDYLTTLRLCQAHHVGDVYELNISCPNAHGGEDFTLPDKLDVLLSEVTQMGIQKPIFLKMPVDIPWSSFASLMDVAIKYRVAGVIIANLTKKKRPDTRTRKNCMTARRH